ncbi:MAG: DUF779 domain-containing protein [Nitrososphaerota archaeon]
MTISLTTEAEQVLRKVKSKHGELHMIIGDTGCCGYSNVFITRYRPVGDYVKIGETSGVTVYLRPPLDATLNPNSVVIDVVEAVADDSLSLETELGYRFILRLRLE